MEDNQSDSYDQSKLQVIRKEIQIPKAELIQLAYQDQKLLQRIDMLNTKGIEHINQQQFYEAIIYLNEAENILQYAAGCGRTIDRVLIITTLHNEASVYQRIWELNKSAVYIQAIIYNITSFLSTQSISSLSPAIALKNSPAYNKFAISLSNKLQLISYQLQFCAVSSQIKNNQNALNSAKKALSLLKNYCEQIHIYEKLVGYSGNSDSEKGLLFDLQNIRDFQNSSSQEISKIIQKLLYKAKKSIVVFQKKILSPNNSLNHQELKELQNFSLGQLMQMNPTNIKKLQQKFDINQELLYIKKIFKAIYISISHFTIATQLRLIASQQYGTSLNQKKECYEFKQSEIHHLIAIITIALYVPSHTKYFDHILNSFKNHYQVDLSQFNDNEASQDRSSKFKDDLIHLETQSISQHELESKIGDNMSNDSRYKHSFKEKLNKEKSFSKNLQNNTELASRHSEDRSQKKKESKIIHVKSLKSFKKSKEKNSRLKVQQKDKERLKKVTPHKVGPKSKSRGKKDLENDSYYKKQKHSISHEEQIQQNQKIVHYFKYDNYSKKLTKKKMKMTKEPGEYELTKRINKMDKMSKDKKPTEHIIKNHLKNIKEISKSTQQYIKQELHAKLLRKTKSPEINTSRSHKPIFKKAN